MIWILGAISLAFVILAPGNAVRAAHFGEFSIQSAGFLIRKILRAGVNASQVIFSIQAMAGLGMLIIATSSRPAGTRPSIPAIAILGISCFGAIVAMFLAPVLLTNYLAPRTRDGITLFGIMLALMIASLGVQRLPNLNPFDAKTKTVLFIFSLMWLLNFAMSENIKSVISSFQKIGSYQASVERRHQFLTSLNGRRDARVSLAPIPQLPRVTHWADVTEDPTRWLNQGVARYYGVGEVYLGSRNDVRFDLKYSPKPSVELLAP